MISHKMYELLETGLRPLRLIFRTTSVTTSNLEKFKVPILFGITHNEVMIMDKFPLEMKL